jgi:branched-chain amino acid aminotransferase
MRWAYLDGSLVQSENALLRADTRAVYGRGLIETMRSYGGRLFRFGAHYERLLDGASVLGIEVRSPVDDLEGAAMAVLKRNEAADARLKLIVTDGGAGGATVAVFGSSLHPDARHEHGMSAVVSETRRNEMSPLSRIKSLQRVDDQLAREAARKRGADEAILLNTRGEVAEGSVSNVFAVSSGKIVTPNAASGALPGVTRRVVLELAAEAGIEALEGVVELAELPEADECFLTNSVIEVAPLTRLDGQPVGDGRPGPVTRRLRQMYSALVSQELALLAR